VLVPVVLPRYLATLIIVVLVLGSLSCGGESSPQGEGDGGAGGQDSCVIPNRLLEDGSCLAPGVQDNGCPAGELGLEDGSCQPAGVPPELCADGFEPLDQGCEPILPPEPCPPGLIAVPGDTVCREVAPCGTGRWGDIPIDDSTEHVDAAYAGGNSDGTADRPWTTISEAIDAAAPGALVAIAGGSYVEDIVIEGKSVRLWGLCPAEVEVVGSASATAAMFIRGGADGTQVHDLAIRGDTIGLALSGSQGVVLDRLWIHGNGSRGIHGEPMLGPTAFTLSGALLEQNGHVGVFLSGLDATIEGTVVRNTLPQTSDQALGRGINIQYDSDTAERASVTIRASLLEQNHDIGVYVAGSDATIEGTVVRTTLPEASDQTGGRGINIQGDLDTAERANVTLRTSLLEQNHDVGVFVSGSDAIIEGIVVRRTQPRASNQIDGWGIGIQGDSDTAERASVTLRASLLEQNHDIGVFVTGSDATIEGTVVRNTQSQASDQASGRGINIQRDSDTAERASVTLCASLLEQNHDIGLFVAGSDATIEGIVVRTTLPEAIDQTGGRGINIQGASDAIERANVTLRTSLLEQNHDNGLFVAGSDVTIEGIVVRNTLPQASNQTGGRGISLARPLDTGMRANITLRASLLEQNYTLGVLVSGSDATIENTVVRNTVPQASNGLFGDGIVIFADSYPASALISSCLIEASARVGVTVFGGHASLATTTLECNSIDLNHESFAGAAGLLDDLGDNRCGCGSASTVCKAVSAGLGPPPPVAPSE